LTGECPLNARAIDILGRASKRGETASLPVFLRPNHLFLNPFQLASRITG
jgi:hypothetical protein